MQAAIWTRYGPPEVLRVEDVPAPVPRRDQVLVRVAAANVFPGDCELRRFQIQPLFWLPLRLVSGIRRPRFRILGQEFAGEVVAVGDDVSRFRVGDRVFGPTGFGGAYAEYLCQGERLLARKPDGLSFVEAAAAAVGGLNALHFVRTAGVGRGQHVVVYGAAGSIGSMAVQLAKAFGAEVTAVDSARKLDALRALGADRVVDHAREDFTQLGERYDAIIDVVGRSPFARSIAVLRRGGWYVHGNASATTMLRRLWASRLSGRRVRIALTSYRTEDLRYLVELLDSGTLRVVIDRCYPLRQIVEAHRYVESGAKIGNVVLTLADPETVSGPASRDVS